ncbi:MAG: helix-turn-helix transcriptional regulator [Actinomycetia bacterium]|nr:helix-turn-helix transcriptional regulator [Actinomycetes bacterium]
MKQSAAVEALAALAHETRIEVFRLLVRAGPDGRAAGAISDELDIAAPTLSFHLKELKGAGLVASQRVGRSQIYRADYAAMRELLTFLTDKCCVGVTECAPDPERQHDEQYARIHN